MITYYLYHPYTKKYLLLGRKITGEIGFECSPYVLAHFIATRLVGEFVLRNNSGKFLPHQAKSGDWEEWKP